MSFSNFHQWCIILQNNGAFYVSENIYMYFNQPCLIKQNIEKGRIDHMVLYSYMFIDNNTTTNAERSFKIVLFPT